MSKPNIVVWGTPKLTVAIAESLLNWAHINYIITTPDTTQGRKKILTPSPLKIFAQTHNIPVFSPDKLNTPDTISLLQGLKADIWLVIAYGKIISQDILDIMHNKILNIHPSLLPQYRGPAPIHASLRNGDATTAVSLMQLDNLMDHGPIIAQQNIDIASTDTYIELEQKIIQVSAKLLLDYLPPFLAGQIIPQQQNHSKASIVSMVKKQDGQINWQNHTAQNIINLYRAYLDWPQVYTYLNTGKKVIFERVELEVNNSIKLKPGYWELDTSNNKLIIGTIDGNIVVTQLKVEGKNSIVPKSFANGYKINYFI